MTSSKSHVLSTTAMPRVLVAGSSGLIGSALIPFLSSHGYDVMRLVRREVCAPDEISWSPGEGKLPLEKLGSVDAVINLAGENISSRRWTARRRDALVRSRLDTTRTLVKAVGWMEPKPSVFLCASAVGYYGNAGDRVLSESSPSGAGFLANLCARWECEAFRVEAFGIRTVTLRTGLVLTSAGGVLAKLLPIFRLGLGGPIGAGRNWLSWISCDDQVSAILHGMRETALTGAVNVVSPEPVRSEEFARRLGWALHRPALLPLPAALLRLAFGNMAEETVLSSQRAIPEKLLQTGFTFRHPLLMQALSHCVG